MANSDKKYRYKGPLNGVTLAPGKAGDKPREIMLYPDTEVALPADNAYVKTLVAQGRLIPVEETQLESKGLQSLAQTKKKEETTNAR